MSKPALNILLAAPRGFCAGVVRAIDILFDGDEPMPLGGLSIAAHPMVKVAA